MGSAWGKYMDEEAANEINGDAKKHPLTSSPFLIIFKYGENKEGIG